MVNQIMEFGMSCIKRFLNQMKKGRKIDVRISGMGHRMSQFDPAFG
jgi:hypothetical protein